MSRRRAGLSLEGKEENLICHCSRKVVSWVVELIVVIGLAYVLVSFFGIRNKCSGPGYGADIGER